MFLLMPLIASPFPYPAGCPASLTTCARGANEPTNFNANIRSNYNF